MRPPGDDDAEMTRPFRPSRSSPFRRRELDDAAADAIVDGVPVDAPHDRRAAFAHLVQTALLDVPEPRPSDELAELLRGGGASASAPAAASSARVPVSAAVPGGGPRRVAALAARVAGLGLLAKVGLGASLAAASVTGAGAAGVLPAPARDAVRDAIEHVTPVDFEAPGAERPAPGPTATTTTTTALAEEAPEAEPGRGPDGSDSDGPVPPDSTGRDRAQQKAGEKAGGPNDDEAGEDDTGDDDTGDDDEADEDGPGRRPDERPPGPAGTAPGRSDDRGPDAQDDEEGQGGR